jgi:hypothetical protein
MFLVTRFQVHLSQYNFTKTLFVGRYSICFAFFCSSSFFSSGLIVWGRSRPYKIVICTRSFDMNEIRARSWSSSNIENNCFDHRFYGIGIKRVTWRTSRNAQNVHWIHSFPSSFLLYSHTSMIIRYRKRVYWPPTNNTGNR